uniref:Homeobox domain-containing protein n=1 Tax=Leersia perrieri TaxID=77586 RepID=A0A0D9WKX2_9ORYZ
MMAQHQQQHHHFFDFSSPPNAMISSSSSSFDHAAGLLSLHDAAAADDDHVHVHVRAAGSGPSPWSQQQVSLNLYNPAAAAGAGPFHQHQQQIAAAPAAMQMQQQPLFQLRESKYLGPVKDLLAEFWSLEIEATNNHTNPKMGKWDDDSSSTSWGNLSLSSMDLIDLERRKARILSMIEEVDRRYRRYGEQMRLVEVWFEAVAGSGAAQVYTKLAMRAMSRHFRCLRDALVGQVRALRKAMGERDAAGGMVAPGATKAHTPRLRVLDQCLRQQRTFQQSGAIDNFPWRPQRGLPERAVAALRAWLFEHFLHPYPNDVDKHILARQTGLSRSQVSNWFINARVRLWKPMIEDMYKEETNPESDSSKLNPTNAGGGSAGNKLVEQHRDDKNNYTAATTIQSSTTATSLLVGQSYHHLRSSANSNNSSSLIQSNIDHQAADGGSHQQLFGHSYSSASASLHGGRAVSLTLGLQHQQPPFSSASMAMQQQQSFMVELAAEEEDDALPYRNLMESQLLHDFAG